MRLAIDVIIGKRGARLLEEAGHIVVVEAQHAERDYDWFMRAVEHGVEVVISQDSDLKILCYDHRVAFLRAKSNLSGRENAQRAIDILQARGAKFRAALP